MPIEIEAKMRIDDPAALAARLQSAGAELIGDFFEVNTFFDTDGRELLAADRGLRLRVSRNMKSGESLCILTHKGPNHHGPLKSRQETEMEIADPAQAEQFLACLGLVPTLSFEKRRQSWKMGDCQVEIDELPHLGRFVEIEGPSERAVMRARQSLGLNERALIKTSYIAMLASHLQERGERIAAVRFG